MRRQESIDVGRYLPGLRARYRRQLEARRALRKEAIQEATSVARLLSDSYPVKRIILFGSLARPDRFGMESDIDLAVEGLPPEIYFKAYSTVSQAVSFPLDLLEWESAKPTLRRRIEQEGVILFER